MSSYLATYYDAGITVHEGDTPDAITRVEQQRLAHLLAVATAASLVSRRLGADATAQEIARDKRWCRRVAHVAQQSMAAWGTGRGAAQDASREGAQVNWSRWWADHQIWIDERMRYIATWAISYPQYERWAKSALVRLSNERRWLEYSFRD